jgi:hypothetical protein
MYHQNLGRNYSRRQLVKIWQSSDSREQMKYVDIASYHTQHVFVLMCGNTKYHTNTNNLYKFRTLSIFVIQNSTMFIILVDYCVYTQLLSG